MPQASRHLLYENRTSPIFVAIVRLLRSWGKSTLGELRAQRAVEALERQPEGCGHELVAGGNAGALHELEVAVLRQHDLGEGRRQEKLGLGPVRCG